MKVTIRVDASLKIGSGHVMRCLTLADALTKRGDSVNFICRTHEGNLIQHIELKGYFVSKLVIEAESSEDDVINKLEHAEWLGSTQKEDAEECSLILKSMLPDWLIVDHYALDYYWESVLKPWYKKLMVIDDLADRRHECDLLLDQTYGREHVDYSKKTRENCILLLGATNALLRPEFSRWRSCSLSRRDAPKLKQLLVTLGGVDINNVTGQVLDVLEGCHLPDNLEITVIMGSLSPHKDTVRLKASMMPVKTKVEIGVSNMAELMANSDLAIGASGATAWERCCLGLPTISIILAHNQQIIARNLEESNSVWLVGVDSIKSDVEKIFSNLTTDKMKEKSKNARLITDGTGIDNVLNNILG